MDKFSNNLQDRQIYFVYGMRGCGKTVLLTAINKSVSKKENWVVINTVSTGNIEFQIASYIQYRFSNLVNDRDVTLESVLEKLKSQNIHLLVTLDEVSSTPEIRNFASIYQLMVREEFNISLIMTGLPEQVSELQNDKVLTFLLRSKRITLSPLNKLDVKYRYREVFKKANREISENVLNRMTLLTNGYAYAFQLLGYLLWQTEDKEITDKVIDSILDEYKEELYRNVYGKIYSGLSTIDREFVDAMTESEDNQTSIKIVEEKMGKPHNYVSIYRRRLLDDQIIISPNRGYVSFTLPFFKDFVIENGMMYE